MKDREPTEFELKILRKIAADRFVGGDSLIHYFAAARRLEKLGYACKGHRWYTTEKGDEYLKTIENRKSEIGNPKWPTP